MPRKGVSHQRGKSVPAEGTLLCGTAIGRAIPRQKPRGAEIQGQVTVRKSRRAPPAAPMARARRHFMVRAAEGWPGGSLVGGCQSPLPARPTSPHARGRGEDRQGPLFSIIAGIRAQGRLSQLSAINRHNQQLFDASSARIGMVRSLVSEPNR
jgi:hypothetical protein